MFLITPSQAHPEMSFHKTLNSTKLTIKINPYNVCSRQKIRRIIVLTLSETQKSKGLKAILSRKIYSGNITESDFFFLPNIVFLFIVWEFHTMHPNHTGFTILLGHLAHLCAPPKENRQTNHYHHQKNPPSLIYVAHILTGEPSKFQ